MKKILGILGVIGLTATSTTSLVACNKPDNSEKWGGNKLEEPTPKPKQPPKNSKWKLIHTGQEGITLESLFQNINNKWYLVILNTNLYGQDYIVRKFQFTTTIKKDKNGVPVDLFGGYNRKVYRWDGVNKPQTPEIDNNTGKISKWNEKTDE